MGGNYGDLPSADINEYTFINSGSSWATTRQYRYCYMPVAGTFKNLTVLSSGDPAPGTYEVTLYNSTTPTALTVTVNGAGEFTDSTHEVSVSVGDNVVIVTNPDSTPTQVNIMFFLDFVPDVPNQNVICGISSGNWMDNAGTYHYPLGAANSGADVQWREMLIPCDGTLSLLFVAHWQNPLPAGANKKAILYINGSPTALVAELTEGVNTDQDTSNEVSVSAGDRIIMRYEGANNTQSARWFWSMVFVPDIVGEIPVIDGADDGTSGTEYHRYIVGTVDWTSTEAGTEEYRKDKYRLRSLYLDYYGSGTVDPGQTNVLTIRLDGADTDLEITLTEGEGSGNNETDKVEASGNEKLTIKNVGGSWERLRWGFVMIKGFDATFNGVRNPSKINGIIRENVKVNGIT